MLIWDQEKMQYVPMTSKLPEYQGDAPKTLSAPFEDSGQQSAYLEKLKAMSAPKPEVVEESVPQAEATSGAGAMGAAGGAQKSMAAGGSSTDVLASGLTGAGAATANPYLVGAGLGLTALSSITKGKNARAAQEYEAEIQKYNQRQQAIARMAQIGQGLKA